MPEQIKSRRARVVDRIIAWPTVLAFVCGGWMARLIGWKHGGRAPEWLTIALYALGVAVFIFALWTLWRLKRLHKTMERAYEEKGEQMAEQTVYVVYVEPPRGCYDDPAIVVFESKPQAEAYCSAVDDGNAYIAPCAVLAHDQAEPLIVNALAERTREQEW